MSFGSSEAANTDKTPQTGSGRSPKSVASQPKLGRIVVSQVLLIDDNPIQLRVRETILRSAGFQVSIATTAESALSLLRVAANHFGVIVTDHVLPGASGAEFVRELRKVDAETPVVVVSGMPDVAEEYEGLNAVVRQKPLPPQELI